MTSLDNSIDIPASSRLSQIGDEILAEQARRALTDDSRPAALQLNLSPERGLYGPHLPSSALPVQTGADELPGAGTIKILPGPFGDDNQRFSDRIADKIYPGLGRIESPDQADKWRLDLVDPSRCKTRANVGLCFSMDLP